MTIVLTAAEVEQLRRPVNGQGGWQSLLRRLQSRLVGSTLTLSPSDLARIRKYRDSYGTGGWQTRLSFLRRVSLHEAA